MGCTSSTDVEIPHIDRPDESGVTSLSRLIVQGKVSSVEQIIKDGADPNARSDECAFARYIPGTSYNFEPHVFIKECSYIAVEYSDKLKLLEEPLMLAALSGNKKIIKLLLGNGAKVDGNHLVVYIKARGNNPKSSEIIDSFVNHGVSLSENASLFNKCPMEICSSLEKYITLRNDKDPALPPALPSAPPPYPSAPESSKTNKEDCSK